MFPFCTSWKHQNTKGFLGFQGVQNRSFGQKWVKLGGGVIISEKFGYIPHLDKLFIIAKRKKWFEFAFMHKQLKVPPRLKESYSYSKISLHGNFDI